MFINLASYQPPPGAPRGHFCCDECCWEQTDDICPLVSVGECVAVEIRSVYINLASHANQVPGHGSISTHLQAREISINITIKSWKQKWKTLWEGKDKCQVPLTSFLSMILSWKRVYECPHWVPSWIRYWWDPWWRITFLNSQITA